MASRESKLPPAYRSFLESRSSWFAEHPALKRRRWRLASAGENNPLQLDSICNIDCQEIKFVDQAKVWAERLDLSPKSRIQNQAIHEQLARCLAIAEDNSETLRKPGAAKQASRRALRRTTSLRQTHGNCARRRSERPHVRWQLTSQAAQSCHVGGSDCQRRSWL